MKDIFNRLRTFNPPVLLSALHAVRQLLSDGCEQAIQQLIDHGFVTTCVE